MIDSFKLERDAGGKPVPTFPHPALLDASGPTTDELASIIWSLLPDGTMLERIRFLTLTAFALYFSLSRLLFESPHLLAANRWLLRWKMLQTGG